MVIIWTPTEREPSHGKIYIFWPTAIVIQIKSQIGSREPRQTIAAPIILSNSCSPNDSNGMVRQAEIINGFGFEATLEAREKPGIIVGPLEGSGPSKRPELG